MLTGFPPERWPLSRRNRGRIHPEYALSADAFGIVVFLYAFSNLSFTDDEKFADSCVEQYHLLREYMFEHSEVQQILAAID
ncbi:MAG TPA: antirestriction protein [Desulfuromonadaceae bacterium]